MKHAAYGLVAAFLATGAYGAIPSTAEDWYEPSGGFTKTSGSGTIYYGYDSKTGLWKEAEITVDSDGNVSTGFEDLPSDVQRNFALRTAYEALEFALSNNAVLQNHKEAIETLGKNLYSVINPNGFTFETTKKGPGGSSYTVKQTIKLSTDGTTAKGETADPIPYGDAVDKKSITFYPETSAGKLQLANWHGASCSKKLSDLLTDPKLSKERADHYVISRHGTDDDATLHYIPFGDVISSASDTPPDGESIEKYVDGTTTNLALAGWNTPVEGLPSLVDLMSVDLSDQDPQSAARYGILAQVADGDTLSLAYLPVGNIQSMTWTTNWTDAVKDIASDEAANIVNWNTNWVRLAGDIATSSEATRQYIDNTLLWTTNWFASTADMNTSIEEVMNYIDGQLDIITNVLAGIGGVIDGQVISGVSSVKEYVDEVMDVQTNVIVAAKLAELNGSIASVKQLVADTFDMLTNRIAGINDVIDGRAVSTINTMSDYVNAEIDVLTNVVVNTKLAELNGSIDDIKHFVSDTFELITNRLAGINAIIDSGRFADVKTVAEYIGAALDIETNTVVNAKLAELNGSIASVKQYIDNTFDWTTNWFESTKAWQADETRNFVRDFVQDVTNAYDHLQIVENWNVVSNFIFTYLGGSMAGASPEDIPTLAPADDPYSASYEHDAIDDYLLPVKNARMLVAITNAPFLKIKAEKTLDFRSVETNGNALAQVFGFDSAPENAIPIKVEAGDGYALGWIDYPTNLVSITTNEIAEIRKWMKSHNVNNILNTIVTNAEKFTDMKTNFFDHVLVDRLLDNRSVWTNGSRQVEIKGFQRAAAYTVPYLDYTQATSEAGRDKDLVWERLPFADSEATRFGAIAPATICATNSPTPDSDATFKMFSLYGFESASVGQVPMKYDNGGSLQMLKWEYVGSATKFVGTDGSNRIVGSGATTNTVEFATPADSAISVNVSGTETGVKITLKVYYR